MKILINQVVTLEGLFLEEEINPAELELETELIKFHSNLKIKAQVSRVINALIVDLNIYAVLAAACSRCLEEFEWQFNKNAQLSYPIDNSATSIDLTPEIREEVILDYPIKPLCNLNCKGLCVKCGKNKNEGGCNCGST
ncbi:MAG: DUF177 domain-containing protein [Candidatus Omnitrophica bacterium]|nr:DUF177 domain-containing protein [Candidatus Omnitrophota bacterium]MBU1924049.1 DUF177 domain-containing protein [Candidatus Omnitrophota bacterium]